jgi:hypothetical protein
MLDLRVQLLLPGVHHPASHPHVTCRALTCPMQTQPINNACCADRHHAPSNASIVNAPTHSSMDECIDAIAQCIHTCTCSLPPGKLRGGSYTHPPLSGRAPGSTSPQDAAATAATSCAPLQRLSRSTWVADLARKTTVRVGTESRVAKHHSFPEMREVVLRNEHATARLRNPVQVTHTHADLFHAAGRRRGTEVGVIWPRRVQLFAPL